jgi:hypothetical protein
MGAPNKDSPYLKIGVRSIPHFVFAFLIAASNCASTQTVRGEGLPTTEQFDRKIKECVISQNNLALRPDLVAGIISIYSAQRLDDAPSFTSPAGFLALMPPETSLEAYRFYVQCIGPLIAATGVTGHSKVRTLTCYGEQDLSGETRREDIIMPLNCPPEVEQGSDFRISASYACGNITNQKILIDERNRPRAIAFNTRQGCFRRDNDPEASKACIRSDEPSYRAIHSCFIVSFHTR